MSISGLWYRWSWTAVAWHFSWLPSHITKIRYTRTVKALNYANTCKITNRNIYQSPIVLITGVGKSKKNPAKAAAKYGTDAYEHYNNLMCCKNNWNKTWHSCYAVRKYCMLTQLLFLIRWSWSWTRRPWSRRCIWGWGWKIPWRRSCTWIWRWSWAR